VRKPPAPVGFAEKFLSFEDVRRILDYDPRTGILVWRAKINIHAKIIVGNIAGTLDPSGYIYITIRNRKYRAHRLAWFWTHGVWPKDQIDHVNGIASDNRIANLREATTAQNSHNRKNGKTNKTGYTGIRFIEKRNVYVAVSVTNGVSKYLGSFETAEAASAAYRDHLSCVRGEFARLDASALTSKH
jgi:hypothetical protein